MKREYRFHSCASVSLTQNSLSFSGVILTFFVATLNYLVGFSGELCGVFSVVGGFFCFVAACKLL